MIYITSSRPYTNSDPHLGTIIDPIYADVYKRFFTITGENVYFSMGTDEHSFKIVDKAVELGVTPKEYVDKYYEIYKKTFQDLNISSDIFMQSSDKKHHVVANIIWNRLFAKGLIYKKSYDGLYCKGCEDFYAPSQLVNNRCPIHFNMEIQKVSEENYFFKLSTLKDKIIDYLKTVKLNDNIYRTEMINFCNDLHDISISRDKSRLSVDWGVTVDNDTSQVMYIWFEALMTYITPVIDDELIETYLEGDEDVKKVTLSEIFTQINEKFPQAIQTIGADNTKFHIVIWAGMLIGLDLPPIKSLIIHGMVCDKDGRKFAKSLGNGYDYKKFYELMGDIGVRFFVLFYCNSTGDVNFNLESIVDQYNSNLGNNLGNVILRIATLSEKYFDGDIDFDEFNIKDNQDYIDLVSKYDADIEIDESKIYAFLIDLKPEYALRELFSQIGQVNGFLEKTKPWTLAKNIDDEKIKEEIRLILCYCLYKLKIMTRILAIFLPKASELVMNVLDSFPLKKVDPIFKKIEIPQD